MKWIPASNPPKDCDEELILQINGKHENVIYEHGVVVEGYYDNGNWYLRGVKLPDEVKVEYWMQLPEPMTDERSLKMTNKEKFKDILADYALSQVIFGVNKNGEPVPRYLLDDNDRWLDEDDRLAWINEEYKEQVKGVDLPTDEVDTYGYSEENWKDVLCELNFTEQINPNGANCFDIYDNNGKHKFQYDTLEDKKYIYYFFIGCIHGIN